VWKERGAAIRSVQHALGGELRPTWAGYELRLDGARIRWRGGLRGANTVVRSSAGRSRADRWLDLDGVRERL